jgi:hypothetical protein
MVNQSQVSRIIRIADCFLKFYPIINPLNIWEHYNISHTRLRQFGDDFPHPNHHRPGLVMAGVAIIDPIQ